MAEYITKEQVKDLIMTIEKPCDDRQEFYIEDTSDLEIAIDELKSEDVAKVIHAKWEKDKLFGNCAYVCTFCHTIWTSSEIDNMHYCPTCGAKMDKE